MGDWKIGHMLVRRLLWEQEGSTETILEFKCDCQ